MTMQAIREAWYFYASTSHQYCCKFDPEGNIPLKFNGPHESKDAAIEAYREWKLEQMETEADEYEPE